VAEKDSPFVQVTGKCPVCEAEFVGRYLKSKAFTPAETEDDRFVRTYKWDMEEFSHIRPEHYHLWHCPECHFTEEKEVFRGEDDMGGKLEILGERLLVESRNPESFLVRLGELIDLDSENVTWSSALASHLLAIYIQNMLSPNMRIPAKLARLYLRTAWLYREATLPTRGVEPVQAEPELEEVLVDLKSDWPDGPFGEDVCMNNAIASFKQELENVGRSDNIRSEISIMFLLVSLFLRLDRKREAMNYVRAIFQNCTKRRGVLQKALENAGRRKDVGAKQVDRIKNLLSWLKNTIERAVTLSEQVTKMIFEDEYPKAREIVLRMKEPTHEQIIETLREKDFYEATSRRVADLHKKGLVRFKLEELPAAEAAYAKKLAEQKKRGGFFARLVDKLSGEGEEA
jgi:hypothetical protein